MTDPSSTETRRPGEAHEPVPPKGIGGWLILPIVQLAATILLTFKELIAASVDGDAVEGIGMMLNAGAPPAIRELLYYVIASAAAAVGLIGLGIACFVQIVRLSRSVKLMMTVFYVVTILCAVVDMIAIERATEMMTTGDPDSDSVTAFAQLIASILRAAIWIPYFWISKRVANTFVA